jgi:hypothetical protein
MLVDTRAISKASLPLVAAFGVDAIESNHMGIFTLCCVPRNA